MKHVACCLTLALLGGCISLRSQTPRVIHSKGNPILADGQYYSADPAPLVVGDTLYILAGRDEAPSDVNDFVMQEWQLLSTGVGVLLVLVILPGGLGALWITIRDVCVRLLTRPSRAVVDAEVPEPEPPAVAEPERQTV